MRENRLSGSEGRESETNRTSLPLSSSSVRKTGMTFNVSWGIDDAASCAFGSRVARPLVGWVAERQEVSSSVCKTRMMCNVSSGQQGSPTACGWVAEGQETSSSVCKTGMTCDVSSGIDGAASCAFGPDHEWSGHPWYLDNRRVIDAGRCGKGR